MIGDVTETLEQLLRNQQQAVAFDVSLDSPADVAIEQANPKVNLFLFRVMENPFAKNQEWEPVGTDVLRYPPLALNLFYVLTPFAADKRDEHRILGEAMRIFYDNSIMEAPLLRGGLEGTAEELKLDLCHLDIEDLTRIWNALNRPYRLSVCYEVRIVLIDSITERAISRVLENEQQFS